MGSWSDLQFKGAQRYGTLLLDVAELVEHRQVVLVSTLPSEVVRFAPQLSVVRRARIRVKRNGIVGPDAGVLHALSPLLHDRIIVLGHFDQVGLYERPMPTSLHKLIGELLGRHLAVLGKRGAAFRREAFDAGLDGHTAGPAEQREHVGLPKVDAGLDAEFQSAGHQSFEQFGIRQEYFVDKIYVLDALITQPVDLFEKNGWRPLPVQIAEILLCAERAVVGTPARCLDFSARTCGLSLEAVMMVMMSPNHLVRPDECRLVLEANRLRTAIDVYRTGFREAEPGKIALSTRQPHQ